MSVFDTGQSGVPWHAATSLRRYEGSNLLLKTVFACVVRHTAARVLHFTPLLVAHSQRYTSKNKTRPNRTERSTTHPARQAVPSTKARPPPVILGPCTNPGFGRTSGILHRDPAWRARCGSRRSLEFSTLCEEEARRATVTNTSFPQRGNGVSTRSTANITSSPGTKARSSQTRPVTTHRRSLLI